MRVTRLDWSGPGESANTICAHPCSQAWPTCLLLTPLPSPCPQPTPLKHISCRNSISRLCWPTQRTAGASARSCEIVSGLDCALDPLAKYRIPAEVGITGFHNCWFIPVGTCTTKKKDRRNTLRNHVLSRSWHFSCISFPHVHRLIPANTYPARQ